ncbi:MAG: hypothetical protein KAG99_06155 [Bacteroidales bacterium]|nr:hypothetical protein [Bacteroidales bacterium]
MKKFTFISLAAILLVFLAVGMITSSCISKQEKNAEERIEQRVRDATGEKVDIDIKDGEITIQTEDGEMTIKADEEVITIKTEDGEISTTDDIDTWPEDIPGDIPEFTYGDIIVLSLKQMDGGHGWSIIFENVSEDALDKYKKALEEKGFEVLSVSHPQGGSITAERDNTNVAVMAGEGNASVSVFVED